MSKESNKQLFLQQMNLMNPKQFKNSLCCSICRGLFRFAHTLMECGHTFCQFCIFTYIKSFKGRNPCVKCPQCNTEIGSNYSRSIMRDVFKQNLVDILEPSYLLEQQRIIQRVKQLFPEEDLKFLLDDFKVSEYEFPHKKKKNSQKKFIMTKLAQKIKNNLNISLQTFIEQISDAEKFTKFQQIINKKNISNKLVQIRPRSQREEQFVGVNHKMKAEGLNVAKMTRFIEKKALEKIRNFPQEILQQFLNPQKTRINIQIQLFCQEIKLKPETDLSICNQPIYYILK